MCVCVCLFVCLLGGGQNCKFFGETDVAFLEAASVRGALIKDFEVIVGVGSDSFVSW